MINKINEAFSINGERKYIVDFMDGSYGTIGMQNGKKIMQVISCSMPNSIVPNQYTLDEIKETGFNNLSCIKEVD